MEKYIAPFILRSEYACHHCGAIPPAMEDCIITPYIYELFFNRFAEMREKWGGPLKISSGYRCPEHQLDLFSKRKSRTPYSVHMFGLALDIDMADEKEVSGLIDVAEFIDPDMRIGFQDYLSKGQTFVHIDVGYLISPIYDKKLSEGARW